VFVPESLRKQNELIRTLQKQLEAKERELADQKWILDQYLNSPSWKITAPLRWIVRQLRAWKLFVMGERADTAPERPAQDKAKTDVPADLNGNDAAFEELKELYASLYKIALQAFLASNAWLDLPAAAEPEVSILLVLFNRAELTLACLRSICENFTASIEVVIVDNGSSDDTANLLGRIRGPRILRNAENQYFLLAANQAAQEARGKYVLVLNNDAQLLPGSLQAALKTIRSSGNIGAVGGRIVLFDGTLQEAGSIIWRDGSCLGYGRGDDPFAFPYMFRRDVDYCSGAFLLTARDTWTRLGGFDELFRPMYYEETDYCTRLWHEGMRVVYEPEAAVLHYEFASSRATAAAMRLQAEHQRVFTMRHAAALESHSAPGADAILHARTHRAEPSTQRRVLFIDDRVPHPWLGSGFPRARSILLTLQKRGYLVTLFPTAVFHEDWPTVYSDLPREIEVALTMGPGLLEAFLRHRRGYYDTIIVSRPHNMNYFRSIVVAHPEWFEDTSLIYDAEALFAPRDIGLRQLCGEHLMPEEISRIYQDEINLASIADCVTAVSEFDRAAFEAHGIERVQILGHSLQTVPTTTPFNERSGFLFIGAIYEEASPNGDSMLWFLSEIWPRIQSKFAGRARLTIAGINQSDRIRSLADETVTITGHVLDLTDLYERTRVFIAPTRFAAGIPHKVHEACARGVPAVITSVLARQLNWTEDREVRIADDTAAFAEQCIELHEDPVLWERIRSSALEKVRRECAADIFERQLYSLITAETHKPVGAGGLEGTLP